MTSRVTTTLHLLQACSCYCHCYRCLLLLQLLLFLLQLLRTCDLHGVVQNTETPPNWKYEKNTTKLQNPPIPGWAPKIQKKYRKNINKNSHFQAIFVIFLYFFQYFRRPTWNGGFCSFFSNFEGFPYSLPYLGDTNPIVATFIECFRGWH